MKICKKCNEIIPNSIVIDGKQRTLNSRKFCLNCRPFNSHNSSKFIDGTRPAFIDSLSNDEFNNLIKSSKSRSEVFDKLKMRKSGESFKILNRRIKKDGVDISHFKTGGYFIGQAKLQDESIFIKRDRDITNQIRLRLLKNKKIEYKCNICKIDSWQNKSITLELDHINGDRYDNRLENLRFLCPNCHSQTETFCGKRKKVKPIQVCQCGNIINKSYKKSCCAECNRKQKENLIKPTKEQLLLDIYSFDSENLKQKYRVRIDKIKKWCLEYNIKFPHKNYWRMRRLGLSHEEALNYKTRTRRSINLLTREQVLQIKKLLKEEKLSLREISRLFNRSHPVIRDIRDNKSYKQFLTEA